jgi:hypothetical protein
LLITFRKNMYRFHRYNLIRWDISSPSVAYKLFVRGLYDYVIVKEETSSGVTTRGYFVAAKGLETSWNNRASLTYSSDIKGRKLVNEGQNWLAAAGRTFMGLLDTYGGAAAAYSLQLLSSDYSGNCVTVRRASDNATLDIGFSNNELDTASLETFCTGTDGFVTTWFDQSGNGKNATQTTASSQPKIVSAGSVILENNKPAIEAVDIFNALLVPSFTSATQMTTVAVSRMYDISENRYITDSTSGRYIVGVFSGTQKYTAFRSPALSGDTAQTTKSSLYFATFDGANSTITNDAGTTYTGDAGTSTFTSLRLMSGVGSGFNGNVQSVIIYNTDQSSNRTGIETALNDYYNIF